MRVEYFALVLFAAMPVFVTAAEEAEPSLELLEYLGEWQDGEGHEIDPQALALVQLNARPDGGETDDEN